MPSFNDINSLKHQKESLIEPPQSRIHIEAYSKLYTDLNYSKN